MAGRGWKLGTIGSVLMIMVSLMLNGAAQAGGAREVVWSASNAANGNAILAYALDSNGALLPVNSYDAGGLGTGGGLGSQGAVVSSNDGRWLLAVNAASDSVAVFRIGRDGLTRTDVEPSLGKMPISIAIYQRVVYVLNAGTSTIAGFRLSTSGDLTPIDGAVRTLSSANAGGAQIAFDPRGETLVVTEKATNLITTFAVDRSGVAGAGSSTPSAGATPFGFGFTRQGTLVVSEAFGGAANASAVSSYRLNGAQPNVVSASVGTTETAACWIVVSRNNRFAYTTNTGSGTLTGYSVAHDGSLALLNADGVTADTGAGSRPIDAAIDNGGGTLYVLEAGSHAISAWQVGADGSLSAAGEISGLPASAVGLATR